MVLPAMDDEEAKERLRKKTKFYDDLASSFDTDGDDAPDPGRQGSAQAMLKGAALKRSRAAERSKNSNGLSRSISDSSIAEKSEDHSARAAIRPSSSAIETGTRQKVSDKASKQLEVAGLQSGASRIIGKRKRTAEVQQVPEEQQVFKGLNFYFFPNNDTNPARKMRIAKALDFGATWVKEFDDSVTHIIVDKTLNYNQLLQYLKQDQLPARVSVVSENYPAECISYRVLLRPVQLQFKVKGHDQAQTSRPESSGSDKSLLLKPASKAVISRQPDTPPVERDVAPKASSEVGNADNPTFVTASRSNDIYTSNNSAAKSSKEFDTAIQQARQLGNIPLDNEDEVISRPTSSEGPTTDDENDSKTDLLRKGRKPKAQQWQSSFQCMQPPTDPNTSNPNAATIAILQQMADYYGQTGDEWRLRAYRKAMTTLRSHPTKIRTKEEALALPQIGERLATKIEEIAYTNRLRRLESVRADPRDGVLRLFMQVYGVGYAQASRWVDAGFKTLDEVLAKGDPTPNQKIGIEHYEDFLSRIPRAEVAELGDVVRKTLKNIDPDFQVIIGGSYRRGADTSSDIDCIITRPQTGADYIRTIVLETLIPRLSAQDFLVAELAATSKGDGSKWHGACHLPGASRPWRRIDLLLVPSAELGAAMIYFTGNDIFNRSLRLLAGRKGMRLNQRGLYADVLRGKGRERVTEGRLVEGKSEKGIFEALGVPWREAWERVC